MCRLGSIAAVAVFLLGGVPPAQAGVVEYAKSCWQALVGAEAVLPPAAPASVLSDGPHPTHEGVGGYRESAKPRREERLSTTGARFVRDETYAALGEAWRAIDGDEEDVELIWGDVVRGADGSVRYMTYADAMEYCIGLNAETDRAAIRAALKAGQAPEHGIYVPLRGDFAGLRRLLGARGAQEQEFAGKGYEPQVLPNLKYWFRSSSVPPDYSFLAYVFLGRPGYVYYFSRVYAYDVAVRCVARR